MKIILASMLFGLSIVSAMAAETKTAPKQMIVRMPIICKGCEGGIRYALKLAPGVTKADVSFAKQQALITYDKKEPKERDIKAVLKKGGYKFKKLERVPVKG